MKSQINILLFLLSSSLLTADDYIPRDIQRLIDIRDAEVQKIDERYREALERLKKRYTQSGDLENALLINRLIEKNKNQGSVEVPLINIESNTNTTFEKIGLGVSRLSGFKANFSWYDKSVEGWFFSKAPWQVQPNYNVRFNRKGTIYIVRMSEFSSEDDLEYRKVKTMAKGAWLDSQQWYEVRGNKGDSFTCTGRECMILSPGFSENHL